MPNNCTKCKNDHFYNGRCVTVCPVSHYKIDVPEKICTLCDYPCWTCLDSITCLSCVPNSEYFYVSSTNKCETECPPGYYPDLEKNKCQVCKDPCIECLSSTECTSCVSGTYFFGISCLDECEPGYIVQSATNNSCVACEPPCQTCVDQVDKCLTCEFPLFYFSEGYNCTEECPLGY